MPIVLRHSETLDLNLVEYQGQVTLAELAALAEHNARHPDSLARDSLNLVLPGTEFAIDLGMLDKLFARYLELFAPLQFELLRRSAWLCQSESAAAYVRHWLRGDTREGMSSAVRQFDTIEGAADWLLLNPANAMAIERREGFTELARFDTPAPRAAAG